MSGLPRVKSTLRQRAVWDRMVLGGIEAVTQWLMSGAEVSEEDLSDMRALRMRLTALNQALEARERAAGVTESEEPES